MAESPKSSGSVRPDGSVRSTVRIRPGYMAPEDRPKYKPPQTRPPKTSESISEVPFYYVTRPYYGKYPSQMTDDELTLWLKERLWLKKIYLGVSEQ